jgi:raffinose/stachyose/melibiose transport system substrate-binding protein
MGSGSWYGVPNYGEFVEVYYNKDAFAASGLEVPTTLDEFEDVLQAFADQGITPLSESAAEYPLGQLWYQLALSKADRSFVDDYQLYTDDVDWEGDEISYATETVKDWTDKGYISTDASGLKAEDAGVSFINGDAPIFFSGSWWHNRFTTEIDGFEWGTFLFPGAEMSPGSAGNMWVVPERAKNKDLAAEFIDITMRPEIQALIGNNGGVPVAADPADITDEKSAELIANFNALTDRDGVAFYPDWPTPTFYDELNAGLQELVNGTKTPAEVQQQLGEQYQAGVDDIVG